MTWDDIKQLAAEVDVSLQEYGAARVEYQPGNGTRYDLVITNHLVERCGPPAMTGVSRDSHWTIGIVNFGTIAEMPVKSGDAPHPFYLADKLCNGRLGDGQVLHLLIAAVIGDDPYCTTEEAGIYAARA